MVMLASELKIGTRFEHPIDGTIYKVVTEPEHYNGRVQFIAVSEFHKTNRYFDLGEYDEIHRA
jgi:hypothetical protein